MGGASSLFGWLSSVLVHAGIGVLIVLIMLGVLDFKPRPLDAVNSAIVPIDVVDFSDYSNVKAIAAEAPRAAEDQPEDKGAPQPESAPEEAEAIPDPQAKPEPKKPDKPRAKPDLDQFAKMIDRAQKVPGQSRDKTASDAARGADPRAGVGFKNDLTVSEMDYMVSRLERCWRENSDIANKVAVVVRVQLNRDGTLRGEPVVMAPTITPLSDPATRVQARRAVNAVRECGPYTEFRPERYASWRLFDLRMNAGGDIQ